MAQSIRLVNALHAGRPYGATIQGFTALAKPAWVDGANAQGQAPSHRFGSRRSGCCFVALASRVAEEARNRGRTASPFAECVVSNGDGRVAPSKGPERG